MIAGSAAGPAENRSRGSWRARYQHLGACDATMSWRHQDVRVLADLRQDWHFHPEIELTFCHAGTGTCLVGDATCPVEPGDILLLGTNLPHQFTSGAGATMLTIAFDRDFLGSGLFSSPDFATVRGLLDRSARGLIIGRGQVPDLRTLLAECQAPAPGARRTAGLLRLLACLADAAAPRELAGPTFAAAVDAAAAAGPRMGAVLRFLTEQYHRELTLGEVAAVVGMSPSAFCRFFHHRTGRTLTAHLDELRISHACRMLIETDLPVTRIAHQSGFGSLTNFNRRFRKLKSSTPREFRSRYRRGTS